MILNIIETLNTDGEIVQALVLNDKWLKPLDELKTTFHENMIDQNTGIVNALWRRDPLFEGLVVGIFDCLTELDEFNLDRIKKFTEENYM